MAQAGLFDETVGARDPLDVFLGKVQRREVRAGATRREASIAIARGLAYDPHVDDRLRLSPLGLAKVQGL